MMGERSDLYDVVVSTGPEGDARIAAYIAELDAVRHQDFLPPPKVFDTRAR